jgi:hypothetical protein
MKGIARSPCFAGVILTSGCLIGVLGFGPRSGMGFFLKPISTSMKLVGTEVAVREGLS